MRSIWGFPLTIFSVVPVCSTVWLFETPPSMPTQVADAVFPLPVTAGTVHDPLTLLTVSARVGAI